MLSQTSFTVAGQSINSFSAMAVFTETTGAVVDPGALPCTSSTEGACSTSVCDATGVVGPATPPPANPPPPDQPASPSASDITISDAQTIVLSPGAKGTYAPQTGQTALFAAGDDVNVTAKGAEIPAFTTTLKAPSIISLTAPAWPQAGTALDIDHTADLPLTWDNGATGTVQVMISSAADKKSSVTICKFSADAGQGTVTAATLGKLVVADTATGSISISNASTTEVDQSGWKINVTAQSPATAAGGAMASGLAHIK
jgi:hypothetical protein